MAHEPAHCVDLVYVGPHADPNNTAHSITDDIPLVQGRPMVNFRNQQDVHVFQANMGPTINRNNDYHMMEGYEWNRLQHILLDMNPGQDAYAQQLSPTSERRFFLSGQIDEEDHWELLYSRLVDEPIPLESPPDAGSHAIRVETAQGQELIRWPFDVTFETADGAPGPWAQVNVNLPYPDNAAQIRIVHGAQTVALLQPSTEAPTLELDELEVDGDQVTVQWSGVHPQGADLRYNVHFSPDDGQSRLPLAVGLSDTAFTWETTLAQGSDSARLIIEASDGWNTAEIVTAPFNIALKPPIAIISEPYVPSTTEVTASGDVEPGEPQEPTLLVEGQPILLRGTGLDLNEGLLDGEDLRWASDIQGPLGISSSLSVVLEAGQHQLTLQAIASSGLVGQATVSVEVLVDRDGDGMPYLYEREHDCLDDRNAEDGAQDQDRDDVTSLTEFRLGTNACRADERLPRRQ